MDKDDTKAIDPNDQNSGEPMSDHSFEQLDHNQAPQAIDGLEQQAQIDNQAPDGPAQQEESEVYSDGADGCPIESVITDQRRSVYAPELASNSVVPTVSCMFNEGGDRGEQNQIAQDLEEESHLPRNTNLVIMPKEAQRDYKDKPRRIEDSLDEDEFIEYYADPVKRKEFDQKRKKMQLHEMKNISAFNIGRFGIRSITELKQQMPDYEESEPDEGLPDDDKKVYSTVSLCCLSVTNPFRNQVIQIVCVSPWFDRFILLVILVNCMFLALDKEVDAVTDNIETIDFVFLIIYSTEMVMKIIAMGFVMRMNSYLRDTWNCLDFTVVMFGWFTMFVPADISAIKVLRLLRPLRTLNQIPNMSQLVLTILSSLPVMLDVTVLFLFMLIVFGTIGTQLLAGHLEKRCIYTDEYGEKFTSFLLGEESEFICLNQDFCDRRAEEWDLQTTCEYYGNPRSDTFAFDNVLLSMLNIFEAITLEGWTAMMYTFRDVEETLVYDFFFLMCVIIGNFIILNLVVAVQSSFLDKAFDEDDARKEAIMDKINTRKEIKKEIEDFQEYDDESGTEEMDPDQFDEAIQEARRNAKKGFFASLKKPRWIVKSSRKFEDFAETPLFERAIIILILLNTLSLASEHYEEDYAVTRTNEIANLFFTWIFAGEMFVKLYGFGCGKYSQDPFNLFDAFIVSTSFIELVVPQDPNAEGGGGLGMLKAARLLRIFKIIKSWDSLKVLLGAVFGSMEAITNLLILIFLFIFILALFCKQFFGVPLIYEDGSESRYAFTDTYTAMITMFIILTGENWTEIMILVIDNKSSFIWAYLFVFMMLLGNFMLLNLFLAILLKSISSVGEDEDNGVIEQNEDDDEGDAQNALGGLNESEPLNSSCSNILEEFKQITDQLMALENKVGGQTDGQAADEDDAGSAIESADNNESVEPNANQNKDEDSTSSDDDDNPERYLKQKSLFIFGYHNPIRALFRDIVEHPYFAGFIYHMIAVNALLLALDEPSLEDLYQKKTINYVLETISIIFTFELVIKVIVYGFYYTDGSFMKDPWNILDFVIVFFSCVTWILEAYASGDVGFLKGFRALRALRPLKVVSKNEGVKTVVVSLLESIPSLINVLLIVMLFLLVFGILGIQLFKGKLGSCTDSSEEIVNRTMCVGEFMVPLLDRFGREIILNATQLNQTSVWNETNIMDGEEEGTKIAAEQNIREWQQPFNRYDHIFISMMTFFEISTLAMWPDMQFAAIDAVGYDKQPSEKNSPFVSLLYVMYIFIVTFFIMNLFVSVIVDKFNEQIKKRQGSADFTDNQKEWVKLMRLLMMCSPKMIPVEPINCFRLQCFRVAQSQAFEYVVMVGIFFNTFFMCIDYHQKSDNLELLLLDMNLFFVVFFTAEMFLKMAAYGWQYYWYVSWNKFDFVIVIMSLVAVDEELLEQLGINVTSLRIMRVLRLFRLVKTSASLRSLIKTLIMSMPNIFNTAFLLVLIYFTFAIAGMSLFSNVEYVDFLGEHVNFREFYIAFMTLVRASTGESWNGIMHDCFLHGGGFIAVLFWAVFQLLAFFIFMNVFIAVIGESFDDNQQSEDENDILALKKKDIKAFQNTWAKYNPMGELYMRTSRLSDFLRELPPPLGYQGIRIEESKLNKIIFCLNIRDHLGRVYYPEVMWTIFHSVAGMNDEKVLKCKQIKIIIKTMEDKYRGLGKKIHLDTLCGNKFYRKEMTAIKYIQAMKILDTWTKYKSSKSLNKDQDAPLQSEHQAMLGKHGHHQDSQKVKEENEEIIRWIKTLGLGDIDIDDLIEQSKDGLIIAKIVNLIFNGSIDWQLMHDPSQKLEQAVLNNEYVLLRIKELAGDQIMIDGIQGLDIANGNQLPILHIYKQLMAYYDQLENKPQLDQEPQQSAIERQDHSANQRDLADP